jgi:hypothetical protein
VQLVQAGVADQVTPHSTVRRPLRRVHKNRHPVILPHGV